jgi:hypothetical protein
VDANVDESNSSSKQMNECVKERLRQGTSLRDGDVDVRKPVMEEEQKTRGRCGVLGDLKRHCA